MPYFGMTTSDSTSELISVHYNGVSCAKNNFFLTAEDVHKLFISWGWKLTIIGPEIV